MSNNEENHDVEITVVVPTHNSEKYIQSVLDSILKQSYQNFEVIIVDSSTSDATQLIISNYEKKDFRIRKIIDSNSSYGHKINVGIERARGSFIAIVESDDLINEGYLEELYKAILRTGVDFVKCDFCYYIEYLGKGISIRQPHCNDDDYSRIIDLEKEPSYRYNATNHIWTGLYRKEFLKRYNILLHESDGASYQDVGFSILCNIYARKICFINKNLYYYRQDNESSSIRDEKKYRCIIDEYDWIFNELGNRYIKNKEIYNYVRTCMHESYIWNAKRLSTAYKSLFLNELEKNNRDNVNLKQINQFLIADNKNEIQQKKIQDLLKFILKYKTLVIWGATGNGATVLKICDIVGISDHIYMCDNDKNKQTNGYAGRHVFKPDEVLFLQKQVGYVICAKKHGADMKSKLEEEGIDEQQIIIEDVDISQFYDLEILSNLLVNVVKSISI